MVLQSLLFSVANEDDGHEILIVIGPSLGVDPGRVDHTDRHVFQAAELLTMSRGRSRMSERAKQ